MAPVSGAAVISVSGTEIGTVLHAVEVATVREGVVSSVVKFYVGVVIRIGCSDSC